MQSNVRPKRVRDSNEEVRLSHKALVSQACRSEFNAWNLHKNLGILAIPNNGRVEGRDREAWKRVDCLVEPAW